MKNESFLAIVMSGFALLCVFGAIIIFMFPFYNSELETIKLEARNNCVKAFKNYGWSVEYRDDESIKVVSEGLRDYEQKLIKASTTQCPYMRLESFCMGFECMANNSKWQGMIFEMSPVISDESNKKRHFAYSIMGE